MLTAEQVEEIAADEAAKYIASAEGDPDVLTDTTVVLLQLAAKLMGSRLARVDTSERRMTVTFERDCETCSHRDDCDHSSRKSVSLEAVSAGLAAKTAAFLAGLGIKPKARP